MQRRLRLVIAVIVTCFGTAVLAITTGQIQTVEPAPAATAALEALLAVAKSNMPVDPAAAGRAAETAEAETLKLPPSKARTILVATALWLRGEALRRQNRAAAAVPLINTALASISGFQPAKLQGDLLQTRGGVESGLGQSQAALQDYQHAYAIFGKVGSARSQAVALQNIGLIYLEANDIDKVFYYYRLAEETFPKDAMLTLSGSANLAGALHAAKRYSESESEYRRAYQIALGLHNPMLEMQMLSNLALAQAVLGKIEVANATLDKAIALWQTIHTPAMVPLLFRVRAELALDQHHSAAAVSFVERALAAAGSAAATRPYWQLQYTAYRAYQQAGDPVKALAHYEIYNQLDDQSRELAASTSAALLAARFDFANQNARIAMLKAGELERDIALARLQARQNMIVLGSLLLIATIIALVLAFYLRALGRSRNAIRLVNAELTTVNAQLNAALAAKSQFLATTSHEIRTPLNGILGMTQVMLADRTLDAVIRERLTLMQGAGETMRALVDDILDFARIDAGKLELHPLPTDLPRLLDEVVEFWRDRAAQQDLVLTFDPANVPERVVIDSRRLRQILANLLSNSIKFTPTGSVTLTVTTVPATSADTSAAAAGESSKTPGERLRIAVTDTGIGIAENDRAVIFEKFRQLEGGSTRRFGGTGLGLAISQMLAQAMGGDIEVASVPGTGSTFTVDLPLARAVAAEPQLPTDEQPASLAAARLMLVGASPIAQGVLRAVLAPRVVSFAVAASLQAAVEQAAARSTDLIVVDVAAGSGAEDERDIDARVAELTAAAIAASGTGVAVVLLWPHQRPADRARLLAAGIAAVIDKPVTSNALIQQLTALFDDAAGAAGSVGTAGERELATT